MPFGAMYPGTFDPVTNGHQELVRRAAKLFDRVVVAVAASPHKETLFDLDQRIDLAKTVFAEFDNVEVDGYEGLTVEYARTHGLCAVIRGESSAAEALRRLTR